MMACAPVAAVLGLTRCRRSSTNCCWRLSIAVGRHSPPTGITNIYFPAIFVPVAHAAQEYVLVAPSAPCRSESAETELESSTLSHAWAFALAVADIVEGELRCCMKMWLVCFSLELSA